MEELSQMELWPTENSETSIIQFCHQEQEDQLAEDVN